MAEEDVIKREEAALQVRQMGKMWLPTGRFIAELAGSFYNVPVRVSFLLRLNRMYIECGNLFIPKVWIHSFKNSRF